MLSYIHQLFRKHSSNQDLENTMQKKNNKQNNKQYNKQNQKQLCTIITTSITELISITISNLAFWFIPQSTELDYSIITLLPLLEWSQILVILVNLVALSSFILLYGIEIHREYWLITNFDYSPRYHSLHLTKYKREYPSLFTTLEKVNRRYNMIYYITRLMLVANIIISSSIIIHSNYANYKTITTLFTNFWISYSKISRGLQISRESLKRGIGIAYYNTQNLNFNRIDPAIKHHISHSDLQNSTHNNTPIPNHTNSTYPPNHPNTNNHMVGNGCLNVYNGGINSHMNSRRPSVISSNSTPSASASTSDSINNSLSNSLNNSFLGIAGSLKEIASIEETCFQCNDGIIRDIPVISL